MLYSENRQDSAQGYHTLITRIASAVVFTLIATACSHVKANTEADRTSDLRRQLLTDSAQDAKRHLGLFVSMLYIDAKNFHHHDTTIGCYKTREREVLFPITEVG